MSESISHIYDGQSFEAVAEIVNAVVDRVNAIYDAVMSAKTSDGTLSAAQLAEIPTINGVQITGTLLPSTLGIQPVTNYSQLSGKPSINGVPLSGAKSLADLGIPTADAVEAIVAESSIPSSPDSVTPLPDGKGNVAVIAYDLDGKTPVTVSMETLRSLLDINQ